MDYIAQLRNSDPKMQRIINKIIGDAERAGKKVTIIPPDEILIEEKEPDSDG